MPVRGWVASPMSCGTTSSRWCRPPGDMGKSPVLSPDRRQSPSRTPTTDVKSPQWATSGQPSSRYRTSSGYVSVRGGGRRGRQSAGETPHTSTGVWVCGRMVGGGYVSSAFSSWNLFYMRFSGIVGGRVRGKAQRPIRYPPWYQVGLCSRRAHSEKVLDAKFLGSLIHNV